LRILVADDDPDWRELLEHLLAGWGYEVVAVSDGEAAWAILDGSEPPAVAILDWVMPGLDGVDVCRRVRSRSAALSTYLILLTAKANKDDVVAGLQAGADDFLIKPFDVEELRARLKAGLRIIELQQSLAARVKELGESLAQVRRLHGLLPICAYCKKIRDDTNYWQQIEAYITEHSDATFTHGICPECYEKTLKSLREGRS
jgi:sigma-B regulation protein RsbU (phosphoserine phosphatase)